MYTKNVFMEDYIVRRLATFFKYILVSCDLSI